MPVNVNVLPPTEEHTENFSPSKNHAGQFDNSAQISQEASNNLAEDNNQAVILDVQDELHNFDTKGNDEQNDD